MAQPTVKLMEEFAVDASARAAPLPKNQLPPPREHQPDNQIRNPPNAPPGQHVELGQLMNQSPTHSSGTAGSPAVTPPRGSFGSLASGSLSPEHPTSFAEGSLPSSPPHSIASSNFEDAPNRPVTPPANQAGNALANRPHSQNSEGLKWENRIGAGILAGGVVTLIALGGYWAYKDAHKKDNSSPSPYLSPPR